MSRLRALLTRGARAVLTCRTTLVALVVLIVGGGLRLHGLDWDQGHHLHPDERFLTMVETAIRFPPSIPGYLDTATSPLNPGNAGHPYFVYGTFPLFLVRLLAAGLGLADYAHAHLVGRAVSALFDVGSIWLTYRLGLRLAGPLTGLAAAGLFAFSPLAIQHAHFFTVDAMGVFWTTAAVLSGVHVAEGGRIRAHVVFGVAAGLAAACRINLLLLVPLYALLIGHAWWTARATSRRLVVGSAVGVLATVTVFRLAQPYAFTGPGLFDVAPAPDFVESLAKLHAFTIGAADFPPSVAWIGRTPVVFTAKNILVWGLGPAWGVAAVAGIVGFLVVRRAPPVARVLGIWVCAVFLYHSTQFTAYARYLLPVVPLLALAAAWSLAAPGAGQHVRRRVLAVVLVLTALWALAFTAIYRRPHTRVEASRWLYEHVGAGATIATEHWDDGLPLPLPDHRREDYRFVELALYADEDESKRRALIEQLTAADWIVISSNRLYRSIPRAPWRYPLARRYYELLFAGELGFRLERMFTSYPRLGPMEFPDDDAEDQFSVLDHPSVLVFRKTSGFSRPRLETLLGAVSLSDVVRAVPADGSALYRRTRPGDIPLPGDRGVRQAVATWPTTSWGALVRWLVTLEVVALACFALSAPAMRGVRDAGWGLAKLLTWLVPAYLAWLLGSLGIMANSIPATRAVAGLLVASGAIMAWRRRANLSGVLARAGRQIVVVEAVFLAVFAVFTVARAYTPAVAWGEKPMDFAILNALLRSERMPPVDPWFAGEPLNYPYFGHAAVATLAQISGVPPAYAFNLAVPTIAALLAAMAFLVGERLTGTARGGLLTAFVVTLLGNLAGPALLLADPRRAVDFHYFWATTRVIEHTINEFPAWNLLFADLHAHVMAQPVEVALLYAASLWITRHSGPSPSTVVVGGLTAWLLGAVAVTSPWSAPSMGGVLLAVFVSQYRDGRPAIRRIGALASAWAGIVALAAALFAPFWMHYRAASRAWGWEHQQAPLGGVLITFGILLAAAVVPLLARLAVTRWQARDVVLVAVGALVVGGAVWARSPAAALFLGIGLVGVAAWRRARDASVAMAAAMVAAASAIGVATEVVYLWDRMNTVFKYYLDIWLVLGCAASAVTWWTLSTRSAWRTAWMAVLAILATAGLFTTVSGAVGFVRFPPVPSERPTLDGLRYLREQAPGELEAFAWLNREIPGVRVLVEAHGPSYQRFARVAMNTGLATPLGWEYHLVQQGRSRERIAERRDDVTALLSTTDAAEAARLLTKYHVDLVFVGRLERETYPARGLAKFDAGSLTETVFRNRDVTIYARPGAVHAANTWIEPAGSSSARIADVPAGRFSQPRGVVRAPDGSLLVVDFGHKRIQRVAPDGSATIIGREGAGPGEFRDPCGIAVTRDGTFYVADTWNHRIQKFSPSGDFLTEWQSRFYGPRGIAVDRDGLLYVADTGNNRIVRFAPDGTVRGDWGQNDLRQPVGIAVMGDEVYVADSGHRRVVVFSTAGVFRRAWPVDAWPPGTLIEPYLAAANDVVWVTDPGGNRVLVYSSSGRLLGTATAELPLETPLGIAALGPTRAIVTTLPGTLVGVTRERAPRS